MRNARVFYSRLNDVDSVILQVVIDDTLADTVILIRVLDYWFLEVCLEIKYL